MFGAFEGNEKKEFRETVSIIDSRGFFTSVVEGESSNTMEFSDE